MAFGHFILILNKNQRRNIITKSVKTFWLGADAYSINQSDNHFRTGISKFFL